MTIKPCVLLRKEIFVLVKNKRLLLHYNTTLATILLLPLVWVSGEFKFLSDPEVARFLFDNWFWFIMTITAAAGFLINIAIFLQIKVTTPLTNTISGTAKACVQTLLGWLIFRNTISSMNGLGILLSLFGSGLYGWVRYKEMSK